MSFPLVSASRGRIAFLLSSVAVLVSPSLAAPGLAQPASASVSSTFQFAIAPQPLASAIVAFSRVSGTNIAVGGVIPANLRSPGARGRMNASNALAALLAGTGYTYRFSGPQSATIVRLSSPGEGAAPAAGAVMLDTIDVSGAGQSPREDEPYRTPGSGAYVTADQIQRVRPLTAGNMFRDVPGVMSASNHNGTAIDVNIRGVQGMDRVKVMVDGTQQSTSTYRGYAGPDNRSYVDPEFIAGIAVEKGPATGPYGSGTIGGVVNMRTLEADDLIRPGRTYGVRVRTGISGNGVAPRHDSRPWFTGPSLMRDGPGAFLALDNWFGSLAAAARNDTTEVVGAFVRRNQGNYFSGTNGRETYQNYAGSTRYSPDLPGKEVPNTSEASTSILLKATHRWGDGHSLQLGFNHFSSGFGLTFPSSMTLYTRRQFPLSDVESRRYHARYRWAPPENPLVDLTLNVWGTTLTSRDSDEFAKFDRSNAASTSFGAELWNVSRFSTPIGALRVSYGAEYAATSDRRYIARGSVSDPTGRMYENVVGRRQVAGLFVKPHLDITDWLSVDAGLRFDTARIAGRGLMRISGPASSPTLTYVSADLSRAAASPSFGITVTPYSGLQIFGRYTMGWRPPSMAETFGPGFAQGLTFVPNLDLRPERSRSIEVGANVMRDGLFTARDRLRLKIAYFNNQYDDYIARDLQFFTIARFVNIPRAFMSGVELSVSYDAGPVFADFRINYFDRVKYCFTDTMWGFDGCYANAATGDWHGGYVQPKYSGAATLGVRLLDEHLVLGTRVNFHGERALPMPYGNVIYAPVSWQADRIVDLFASYKVNENVTVSGSVENVFDRYYISPLAAGRIASPGRTARLTVTGQF